jgi:hypothetical protein
MKRNIAPIEEDVCYLLDWASTGLLWLGFVVTINAIGSGIEGRWVSMACLAVFAIYVFVSSALVHRRADRYRLKAKEEPPRHVNFTPNPGNFIHNPGFVRGWPSDHRDSPKHPDEDTP